MVADESGGWFTVTKKGHKKAEELRADRQDNDAARDVLKGSETGDRPGRKERDVFEDVTESSASQTETSSRTSRSASPSTVNVSGEIEEHKAKSKRNRTRKSKPTPGQSPLSLLALNAAIENAKSTYGEDQRSQLGFVTDVFITHYRSSELPFRKTLQEQPIQKVCLFPYRHMLLTMVPYPPTITSTCGSTMAFPCGMACCFGPVLVAGLLTYAPNACRQQRCHWTLFQLRWWKHPWPSTGGMTSPFCPPLRAPWWRLPSTTSLILLQRCRQRPTCALEPLTAKIASFNLANLS